MTRFDEQAYRTAEEALFAEHGAVVTEHVVAVPGLGTSVRVLEIGAGDPIVFIHGSPNDAATWVSLATEISGRRCLLLERPGAGLSAPVDRWADHRADSVAIVTAVVDHFGLDRVDLAGSSFGGLYAYNFALAHPDRVRSIVQLGAPAGPTVLGLPGIFRFLSLPLPKAGAERALRPDAEEARKMYSQIGHGAAVESGAIPPVVFDWYSALLCTTDTARNLLGEIRAIATPFGFRRSARLDAEALGGLAVPVLYLWGSEDSFGSPEKGDRLAALTPGAVIEHFDGFGHLPWYDDAALVAGRIERFLTARSATETR